MARLGGIGRGRGDTRGVLGGEAVTFRDKIQLYRIYSWFTKEVRMKGWRTITVNVLTLATTFFAWPELSTTVDPQYIVMGQAVVNILLRFVTSTPVALPMGGK